MSEVYDPTYDQIFGNEPDSDDDEPKQMPKPKEDHVTAAFRRMGKRQVLIAKLEKKLAVTKSGLDANRIRRKIADLRTKCRNLARYMAGERIITKPTGVGYVNLGGGLNYARGSNARESVAASMALARSKDASMARAGKRKTEEVNNGDDARMRK